MQRVAKAWLDMVGYGDSRGPSLDSLSRQAFGRALFKESILNTSPDGLIMVRDIPLAALSQENLLPFYGRCHIGYIPSNGRILGLSKLARVTRYLSMRIQTPQRLANDLMDAVARETGAKGVAVVVETTVLGNLDEFEKVQCTASCGCFVENDASNGSLPCLNELMLLLGVSSRTGRPLKKASVIENCDTSSLNLLSDPNDPRVSRMANAVETLLTEVGVNVSNDSLLRKAARRYVAWLISATHGYKVGTFSDRLVRGMDLGPPTPDNLTGDSTDSSLEDVDTDMDTGACCVNIRADRCQGSVMLTERLEVFTACFTSQCEHHLLPFHGTIKLVVLIRESLASWKDMEAMFSFFVTKYSHRLQVQERLTQQIADAVFGAFGVPSLLVVCESTHMCMVARGVEVHSSQTLTTGVRGLWAKKPIERCKALDYVLKTACKVEI